MLMNTEKQTRQHVMSESICSEIALTRSVYIFSYHGLYIENKPLTIDDKHI